MEVRMWEQIAHIGRFTAGRQQGLWREEQWSRGVGSSAGMRREKSRGVDIVVRE
jgi:hypothetical protein